VVEQVLQDKLVLNQHLEGNSALNIDSVEVTLTSLGIPGIH